MSTKALSKDAFESLPAAGTPKRRKRQAFIAGYEKIPFDLDQYMETDDTDQQERPDPRQISLTSGEISAANKR
jgi:hypothetical protein